MSIRTRGLLASLSLGALVPLVVGACGTTTTTPPSTLALDRPVDVAFTCFGSLRITGGGRAGLTTDTFADTATPLSACDAFAVANVTSPATTSDYPLGQEDLSVPGAPSAAALRYYALILQSVPGTVAVAGWDTKPAGGKTGMISGDVQVQDLDPLQPGESGISIGDLPVGIATDRNGCFAVTANAGTCDLSTLDISSALKPQPDPIVTRVDVVNGAGAPILAKPSAIVAPPVDGTVGVACPAKPAGIVYVAYPECHRVAAIDAATGAVQSSIVFDAAGNATIDPDPSFTCPAECGSGAITSPGTRPSALDLVDDLRTYGLTAVPPLKPSPTRRLAIGADNSNRVTVIDLDDQHLPTGTPLQITLEGSVGVTKLALTPQIGMGGDGGAFSDDPAGVVLPHSPVDTMTGAPTISGMGGAQGGQFQFVYAVATDGTVRVADTLGVRKECDTEIDPRGLIGINDIHYLSCIPVGDPSNPPRRAGVKGPGIELIGDARPLAVTVVDTAPQDFAYLPQSQSSGPLPDAWIGSFALITSTAGPVYVVNIDDDNYPDVYDPTKPIASWIPLALPHQLRDRIANRSTLAEGTDPNDSSKTVPVCNVIGHDPNVTDLTQLSDGPRFWPTDQTTGHPIAVATSPSRIASTKLFELPTIRQVLCVGNDATMPVPELSFAAPVAQRAAAFPDLRALRTDETWLITWEGTLSNDASSEHIDGPIDRIGQAIVDGTGMRIVEDTHPYCAMGVEPYDQVVMRGCDPNVTFECGYGNSCYVDPLSPTNRGSCLPTDQVDALSKPCHEFLVSQRRYVATSVKSGELRLMPRRHVLRTTPISGCTSADQCKQLEAFDRRLAHTDQPGVDAMKDPGPLHTWACEPDPSRPTQPNQCAIQCTTDDDCNEWSGDPQNLLLPTGLTCDAGRCVEGVVPPLQCLGPLQRYEVHASEAFTVVGSVSGYLHPIIADANGTCVKDPNANPLQVGRIPLTAPPCPQNPGDPAANPCKLQEIDQAETDPLYADAMCTPPKDGATTQLVQRKAQAIRFANPMMTFEMVDPTYPGDLSCIGDRMGGLTDVPIVFPGYALQLRIVSGFLPYFLNLAGVAYPANIVRGPLESIWVLDEGDYLSATSASTRGRVYRVESVAPNTINVLQ